MQAGAKAVGELGGNFSLSNSGLPYRAAGIIAGNCGATC
jgi:hypothetical protein